MNTPQPHPFAPYVAILGRGKTKSRPLTFDEARAAMGMILRGEALPEQIGAFLMLLRLKEETAEEIAGFAQAVRDQMPDVPMGRPDVDWSSYAGKRVQLPWYMLSIMCLVQNGISVFMHGTEGHTPGRIYTAGVLRHFEMPIAMSLQEASAQIEQNKFAYLPLTVLNPKMQELMDLKPILGLRSPVNTFTRLVNPLGAPTVMQGIFHRGFLDIHAGAAQILDIPRMAVFRGDGGEIETRPNKPTPVWTTNGGVSAGIDTWNATLDEGHAPPDPDMKLDRLRDVWSGADKDAYGVQAAVQTLAVTLKTMGRAEGQEAAMQMAQQLWAERDRSRFEMRFAES